MTHNVCMVAAEISIPTRDVHSGWALYASHADSNLAVRLFFFFFFFFFQL